MLALTIGVELGGYLVTVVGRPGKFFLSLLFWCHWGGVRLGLGQKFGHPAQRSMCWGPWIWIDNRAERIL